MGWLALLLAPSAGVYVIILPMTFILSLTRIPNLYWSACTVNCYNVWSLNLKFHRICHIYDHSTQQVSWIMSQNFCLSYALSLFNDIYLVWWISNTWLLSKCFKTSVDLIKLYNYFISLQFKNCNHLSLMWISLIFQRAWSVVKKSHNPFSQVYSLCLFFHKKYKYQFVIQQHITCLLTNHTYYLHYLLYLLNCTIYIMHHVAQSVFATTNLCIMYWK